SIHGPVRRPHPAGILSSPMRAIVKTARVGTMPLPGRSDDFVEIGPPRAPVELLLNPPVFGDQSGNIARPAGGARGRACMPCPSGGRLDHLTDGCAAAGPAIQEACLARLDSLQGADVGVCQVFDVHVVADTGAIGGVIVSSMDCDGCQLAQSDA